MSRLDGGHVVETDQSRPPAADNPSSGAIALKVPALSGAARWVLNLAVAACLLALVIWKVQPEDLRSTLSDLEPWPLVGAVALNLPVLILMTVRGQIILAGLGHRIGILPFFPISTFGNVLGNLTPAALGDLLRTPFMRSRHDVSYEHGVVSVVYERTYSVLLLALGTGVAAAWIALSAAGGVAVSAGAATIAIATPFLGAGLLERVGPHLTSSDDSDEPSTLARLRSAISMSLSSLVPLLRDLSSTAQLLLINGSMFSIMAMQFWLVCQALDISLNAAQAWAIFGGALLAGIFTFLPLGLGTFDVALAALLGAVGQSAEEATAAALLVRVTQTLPQGIAAVLCYLYLTTTSPDKHIGE